MTIHETYYPDDPLYEQAKKILASNPDLGKKKLGILLGVKPPSSRLRIVRYRGETEGHSTHPDYVRLRQCRELHPDWSTLKLALTLGLTVDHAKLHLARWTGAQAYPGGGGPAASAAAPAAAPVSEPAAPAGAGASKDNELQDNVRDQERDLAYRGTRIKTLEDLLIYAEVDTSVWEVERHVLNKYEVAAKMPEGMTTTTLFQIKAWLRRKVVEQNLQSVLERLLVRFRDPVVLSAVPRFETADRRGLLELSLMDLHFGKYCSLLETGRSRWLYSQASLGLRLERLAPAVYDGDFDAAARAAQALIALDPKNADAYMALGILDWHRGRVDECLANLRQALALDPSRDYLKAIIQRTEAR